MGKIEINWKLINSAIKRSVRSITNNAASQRDQLLVNGRGFRYRGLRVSNVTGIVYYLPDHSGERFSAAGSILEGIYLRIRGA